MPFLSKSIKSSAASILNSSSGINAGNPADFALFINKFRLAGSEIDGITKSASNSIFSVTDDLFSLTKYAKPILPGLIRLASTYSANAEPIQTTDSAIDIHIFNNFPFTTVISPVAYGFPAVARPLPYNPPAEDLRRENTWSAPLSQKMLLSVEELWINDDPRRAAPPRESVLPLANDLS